MNGLGFTAYVDGAEQGSAVVARLRQLCRGLGAEPNVDVVDVRTRPEVAEAANIISTPTVVKEAPAPRRRLIGALDDDRRVAMALGIDGEERQA